MKNKLCKKVMKWFTDVGSEDKKTRRKKVCHKKNLISKIIKTTYKQLKWDWCRHSWKRSWRNNKKTINWY